ncbi:MAG: DUF4159 domain-containing protein, partial [Deltaproteobacteria bacterium]|nr:DUF4159 domain-containing protein [Deltaproteobacteria bacterium]
LTDYAQAVRETEAGRGDGVQAAVAGGGGEAGDGEEQLAQGQLSNVDEPQLAQAMEPQVQQLAPNGLFGPQQRLEWNDEGGPNLQRLVRGRGNLAVNRLGQRGGGGGMAPGEAIHEPFRPPLTAAKVQRGIQDAVLFLRSMQAPDGSIGEGSYAAGGNTALAVLAMLAAGGDPAADRSLQQALDWLLELEADNTYVRAIRANVWEYALRKVPYHERLRTALEQDFQWLRRALGDRDGWRYSLESTDWDNSCTQYGVLGMWAAARAGHDPGDGFWQRMSRHFRKTQNRDGGWGYVGSSGSSANMATAGLASMFLVFDMYHGKSYYQADQPRTFSAGEAAEVLASLERGMKWLGASSSAEKANSYYLYGIERAGVASGRKYIGGEDWFASGALTVLTAQQPDGSIQLGYGPVISTAFSTLFLVYGGAPVAFNKLEHGKGQDWNLNPRDLANLSKYLWVAYERPLSWHSVSIDAEAGELEAPVLFLSGSKALQLNDGQVAKLRGYVRGGGTILAEPSDHAAAFRTSAL